MRIPLKNPAARISLIAGGMSLVFFFLAAVTLQFAAAVFSARTDAASLKRAVELQPQNADYHYRLGQYNALLAPEAAAQSYRAAVALDPYRATYWLALARVYRSLGNRNAQNQALMQASLMGPTDREALWETANAYYSRGDIEETLKQCRNLLQDNGPMFGNALSFCWKVKPDIDLFLNQLLPRATTDYATLLSLFISRHDTAHSERTWLELASLGAHVPRQLVFEYVRYLLTEQEPDFALRVWKDAGPFSNLSDYQPTQSNLMVNGDFEARVLNGGFDWLYQRLPGVSLSIDPDQHPSGGRSLLIAFNDAQIADPGIQQFVPVHPGATYDFSSYFKTQAIEGAGGVRFAVQDAYNGSILYTTGVFSGTHDWQQMRGDFTAGAATRLVSVRLQRVPPDNVIKGKIWIDGIHLTEQRPPR